MNNQYIRCGPNRVLLGSSGLFVTLFAFVGVLTVQDFFSQEMKHALAYVLHIFDVDGPSVRVLDRI